jgi:outer membrane protein assembly factor BamD
MPGNKMIEMSHRHRALLTFMLVLSMLGSGCLPTLSSQKKKKTQPDLNAAAQPDKILYDRATDDFKHGRYTIARLNLQTLINTYPDSEYLAKAKLAIADSYFKEGGTENLLQAIAQYKDFITFFPFLDEAAYAQMQVASTYYRLMEKSDRDRSDALNAEQEFQTFLLKYPHSPLVPVSEQHLRDVQEVIADGDFRIAQFYYVKGSYRAAAARLIELAGRYPLYSQADRANWMLADIYQRNEKQDVANQYYARIVRDYPLSSFAAAARKKLIANGATVPQPDPYALKRMQQDQLYAKNGPNFVRRKLDTSLSLLHSGPDVSHAARTGTPDMQPEGDLVSATQVLQRGKPEPQYSPTPTEASAAPTGSDSGGPVGETTEGTGEGGGGGTGIAVEAVPDSGSAAPASVESSSASSQLPSETPSTAGGGGTSPESQPGAGQTAVNPAATPAGSPSSPAATTGNSATPTTGSTPASTAGQPADKLNSSTESTSKKKKGWHKLIPW